MYVEGTQPKAEDIIREDPNARGRFEKEVMLLGQNVNFTEKTEEPMSFC